MPFSIVTTTNARRDIQKAIDWENDREPGLGEYFFEQLEKKINALAITPGMGSVRYKNIRITYTDVFSYNIHYTINKKQQQVIILRVLHSSKKPIW